MVTLTILLFLQMNRMEGMISGIIANLLTLILMLPTFLVFRSWLKKEELDCDLDNNEVQMNPIKSPINLDILQKQFLRFMINASLTERETEVAWLIYRGYTNLQIAEELFISEATVKKHATHIYEKLKISGRKELKNLIIK